MAKLGKLDLACVGFMAVIILIGSGYLAIFAGWMLIGATLVWLGWVWWVVFILAVIALLILVWSSRRQMPRTNQEKSKVEKKKKKGVSRP